MLTVFFNYIGMMSVGFIFAFQTWYADRKQRKQAMAASSGVEYNVLMTDAHDVSSEKKKKRALYLASKCILKVDGMLVCGNSILLLYVFFVDFTPIAKGRFGTIISPSQTCGRRVFGG